MKTHWLHGSGPEKRLTFAKEIDVETDCRRCIHTKVCTHRMEQRCENYVCGTSVDTGCVACHHKYTRFDQREPVPCFSCPDFLPAAEAPPP